MTAPFPSQHYAARVEEWVFSALGTAQWSDFLRCLPGVYPSDALAALRRIGLRDDVSAFTREAANTILIEARTSDDRPPYQPWRTGGRPLAVPHPLDFEWRFTPDSADALLDRCASVSNSAAPVVLIGAPTVFVRAVERGEGHRYTLLDKNRATVGRLLGAYPRAQAFVHDACVDPPPRCAADVSLLDPPWYDPHVRGFLWTASLSTRPGGTILLSLPPVGTRPGILEERAALFAWVRGLGLDLVDLEEGRIAYVSPPFEWNALSAEGIGGCPHDWRCGDLATLRLREDSCEVERPAVAPMADPWPEIEVRGVRVRFSPSSAVHDSPPSLLSIVPGDVLPSVSARDDRRQAATVWTSGNRVFACSNPLRLRADLQSALGAGAAGGAYSAATGQLLDVILREEREYAACD